MNVSTEDVSTEATSENDNNARMDRMRGPSNSENRTANNNGAAFMNSAVANDNVNVAELNNNIHGNPFLFSIDPSRLLEMERCVRLTQKKIDQMTERLSKCMKYVALLKRRHDVMMAKKSQQRTQYTDNNIEESSRNVNVLQDKSSKRRKYNEEHHRSEHGNAELRNQNITCEESSGNVNFLQDQSSNRGNYDEEHHRSEHGNAGLRNQNVTCYSNAIFQAIASCSHLTTVFDNVLSDSQRCFRLNYEFVRLLHSMIHQSDCFDPQDFVSLFLRRNSNFDEQCASFRNINLNEYQFYLTWLTDTALLFYFQPTQVNFSSC